VNQRLVVATPKDDPCLPQAGIHRKGIFSCKIESIRILFGWGILGGEITLFEETTGWEIALWSLAAFAAVMLLLRIMLKFRQFWVDYYHIQAEAARRKKSQEDS
jgi:hypothetical protein